MLFKILIAENLVLRRNIIYCIIVSLTLCGCNKDEVGPSLSKYSLSYPADNDINIIPGFQFQWEISENAESYELHLGKNANTNDLIIQNISGTSIAVDEIQYGKTYFWKVLALDKKGNSLSSPTYQFVTKKNYRVLNHSFYMPQLDRSRKISIYLPPNYVNESNNYPVIYMHDGQAIFDTNDYPYEEWEVDETLDKLYQDKGFNIIVVGIDYNTEGANRLTEYSPWINTGKIEEWATWSKGLGGEGDEYVEFLVETLKPYIDDNYRTLKDKDNTGIIGSSMGGLISCYAGLQYPNIFGKVGVYSPSFWFSEGEIYNLAASNANLLGDSKFYFLAGDSETKVINLPQDLQDLINILVENNFPENNTFKKIIPNGKHEEYLWREGFKETVEWLFIE